MDFRVILSRVNYMMLTSTGESQEIHPNVLLNEITRSLITIVMIISQNKKHFQKIMAHE